MPVRWRMRLSLSALPQRLRRRLLGTQLEPQPEVDLAAQRRVILAGSSRLAAPLIAASPGGCGLMTTAAGVAAQFAADRGFVHADGGTDGGTDGDRRLALRAQNGDLVSLPGCQLSVVLAHARLNPLGESFRF